MYAGIQKWSQASRIGWKKSCGITIFFFPWTERFCDGYRSLMIDNRGHLGEGGIAGIRQWIQEPSNGQRRSCGSWTVESYNKLSDSETLTGADINGRQMNCPSINAGVMLWLAEIQQWLQGSSNERQGGVIKDPSRPARRLAQHNIR